VASNEKTGVPCSLFLSKIAVDTESVVVRIEETLSGQSPRACKYKYEVYLLKDISRLG
jgi:hypothetical protein